MSNKGERSFFKHGDLVQVDGYETRIFEILGYRVEQYFYPDEQHTDIVFELSDAHTLEWLEADENDLTLICREDKAEEYLANAPIQQVIVFLAEGITEETIERKLTLREQSSREAEARKELRKIMSEVIDDLLVRRKDYEELYAIFGDEQFNDVIFAIDAEINKLNEES
jgi:hypothetical protein